MEKIIRNVWQRTEGDPFERALILRHEVHPEGFEVTRTRFFEAGRFVPAPEGGHLISVIRGKGVLETKSDRLAVGAGVHLYLPPRCGAAIVAETGTEMVQVSAPTLAQTRGTEILLRDETFLSACAAEKQSLRWILTPQYLSRRIFLHHDRALLSKAGRPVSWFRTTMFDVAGLPPNQDGEPVFKMSYNSRTEFNVLYEVHGDARVRFACHPYQRIGQTWDPWMRLDGDSTYHLNESEIDPITHAPRPLRNKHEVYANPGGYVSLFCLFDPAPTGVERHRPGEYSDYEPIADVLSSDAYAVHRQEIAKYDRMVDRLSIAKAKGETLESLPEWQLYETGRTAQTMIEVEILRGLATEGKGRKQVVERWTAK